MKFSLPSSLFCMAFLSVASATTCDPDLVNDAADIYEDEPISIVSRDTTSVTFTVSQTWSDDLLCLIATHYSTETGEACPDVANAGPGEVAEYTAQCVDGVATVDLYVYEPTFLDNTSPPTIASICEQTTASKTYLYQYTIPCGGSCPNPPASVCEAVGSFAYDFEDTGDVEAWLFGKQGSTGGNSYLQLDTDLAEFSKKFDIPSDTGSVKFSFEFSTISAMSSDQKLYARVGDYYLNISPVLSLGMGAAETHYYSDMKADFEKIGFGSTVAVSIEIPSSMFTDGSLSLGVRTFGSDTTYVAAIDNVNVDLTCGFTDGSKSGGGGGDPHFQRWDREHISFHGECDLVMVHSDRFHNNAGLDLHVRTTIQDYFSYIESAALRIGKATLEFHQNHFFLDGSKYTADDLPLSFGQGEFKYTVKLGEIEANKNAKYYQYYQVDLGDNSSILFKYYKKFLTIDIDGHARDFSDSIGLLGDYSNGDMLSREGLLMHDFDQYGFEWQVNPEDAKLFLDARAPQLPYEACRMPTAARPARRKLRGADAALFEAAKTACAHVRGSDYDLCTDDVMSTGDVGLATLW